MCACVGARVLSLCVLCVCGVLQGEKGTFFFIVRSGQVRITDLVAMGRDVPDEFLGAGLSFGERALLLSEPRAGTAIATEDVRGCRLLCIVPSVRAALMHACMRVGLRPSDVVPCHRPQGLQRASGLIG